LLCLLTYLFAYSYDGDYCLQANGFPDALEDAQLLSKPECVSKVLAVIASALQSRTNMASAIHLLNIVRTSPLMNQHLAAFFTNMPAERSMPRQRNFRQAIKVAMDCNSVLINK